MIGDSISCSFNQILLGAFLTTPLFLYSVGLIWLFIDLEDGGSMLLRKVSVYIFISCVIFKWRVFYDIT
jgi:hypothetical protein